ncbi:MAG: TolC family protein [Ramlibacter sp.]|nr:TolC family protein [Ramlibacter sp.]
MVPIALFGRLALAGSLILLPTLAWTQAALTLPEAQRIALSRSQLITAQDAAAQSAREMAVAAGQLPDPVLKLGVENVPVTGPDRLSLSRDFMTMRRVGVMQELPRSDKRRLKVERVERDIQRIQAERSQAVATVQRETALAWIDRYYGQATLELLRKQFAETQLQGQGAEIAYRSGRGSQGDVFAARAALAGLRDKLAQTERQARSAGLMLARWVGPDAQHLPLQGPIDWRTSAGADGLASHLAHLPQLEQLAAQTAAAETELRQAQANTRADWTVEATYSQRGSAYSNMVSIGVSIPLQLDRANRQDREVAAKRAALNEAQAKYQDALVSHEAEVRVLLNDWHINKERIAGLSADLLPAAGQRTDAALTAYRSAKGDLAAVLSARRDEIDARMQILSLEMETARLWAQLAYLIPDTSTLPARGDQP